MICEAPIKINRKKEILKTKTLMKNINTRSVKLELPSNLTT